MPCPPTTRTSCSCAPFPGPERGAERGVVSTKGKSGATEGVARLGAAFLHELGGCEVCSWYVCK